MIRSGALLAALALTGCGVSGPRFVVEDPALLPHVAQYESEAAARDVDLAHDVTVRFGAIEAPLLATCRISNAGVTVTLGARTWDGLSELQRTALVFHELGHCALHLDHDSSLDSNGFPVSLMYPYGLATGIYALHWDAMVDRLFEDAR